MYECQSLEPVVFSDLEDTPNQSVDYSELLKAIHPLSNQLTDDCKQTTTNNKENDQNDDLFTSLIMQRNQPLINMFPPLGSPHKSVYDINSSQFGSPQKVLSVNLTGFSPSPKQKRQFRSSTSPSKLLKSGGNLVENGVTPSRKIFTPTPLSALEIRHLRLQEILRQEDPDPEWTPDSSRRRRNVWKSKDCDVAEDMEVDDDIHTPSRNLRPRKSRIFDDDDDLPLAEIRIKMVGSEDTEKEDGLELSMLSLSPVKDEKRLEKGEKKRSGEDELGLKLLNEEDLEKREILKLYFPKDGLLARNEDSDKNSSFSLSHLPDPSGPINTAVNSLPSNSDYSQTSIQLPTEFEISSADDCDHCFSSSVTPRRSVKRNPRRKSLVFSSVKKRKLLLIESSEDEEYYPQPKRIRTRNNCEERKSFSNVSSRRRTVAGRDDENSDDDLPLSVVRENLCDRLREKRRN